MKFERNSQRNKEIREDPSKKSIVALFVLGFILITVPVVLVMEWPSGSSCNSPLMAELCQGSRFYWASARFLPYAMLAGGLLVGYNMKRIADASSLEVSGDS